MTNILHNDEYWWHKAEIHKDENPECVFKWHFPRGTLQKQMSALELSEFLMPHMPSILPLLSEHTEIKSAFEAMLILFLTQPKNALDELLPWVKSVTRTSDFDIIEMDLMATPEKRSQRFYSIGQA